MSTSTERISSGPMSSPPPLPAYVTRKTPPPIPARRWKPDRQGKLNATAVVTGLLILAGLVGWKYATLQREAERSEKFADATNAKRKRQDPNSLRNMAAAIQGMQARPLNDTITVLRIFPNRSTELRYQLRLESVSKADIKRSQYFYAHQRDIAAAVATDAIAEPVLRRAPAIFVDVYDREDVFLFSYDWREKDVWPDTKEDQSR